MHIKKTLNILTSGVHEIISETDLIKKLKEKKFLNIKFGCDPTSPNIHLGHIIALNKLKQLQELGHIIYFLIGDFTAKIGDPSGRDKTRPQLTNQQIQNNIKYYKEQILKILSNKNLYIVYNSSWLNKFNLNEIIKLSSCYTVSRMLERNDFKKRFKNNLSISIHEFIYPLIQGYDSYFLKSDIEIGGVDQKFNLLMGREVQKQYNQKQQIIIMLPLLEGIDGIKKMSKSSNNYININEKPYNIFGKIMSISDNLMWVYYEKLNIISKTDIQDLKNKSKCLLNPKDMKIQLAKKIVSKLYNSNIANQAHEDFIEKFQKKIIPTNIEIKNISLDKYQTTIIHILKKIHFTKSLTEARRLIQQGAVKINKCKIYDNIEIKYNTETIVQVGKKKFIKIIIHK